MVGRPACPMKLGAAHRRPFYSIWKKGAGRSSLVSANEKIDKAAASPCPPIRTNGASGISTRAMTLASCRPMGRGIGAYGTYLVSLYVRDLTYEVHMPVCACRAALSLLRNKGCPVDFSCLFSLLQEYSSK